MPAPSPLDADALVATAEEETGLDGWGAPAGYWREGLDVLVASLETEARLSDTGRLAFGSRLGQYLRQRLQIIAWRRRHREIADEVIDAPVIITGLPRTGSTALSNLLAQDPDTRSLRVWESGTPTPPPEAATQHDDPRIAATQAGLDVFEQMVPAMRAMHHDTATSTAEAVDLLGMSVRTHHFAGMADVEAYDRWWLDCDMGPAYAFQRDVLQLLQWRCPPTRWHLKNPPDLFCLGAVAATYPDVRFLWTHRHPVEVLPSVASLIATVQTLATDSVDPLRVGAHQLELWATAVERGLAWRAEHPHPFVDVHMGDLAGDPIATVASVYDAVGWPFTTRAERAMRAWVDDNPPGVHGEHRPDPRHFGLEPAAVAERFERYTAHFDLEDRP